MKTLIETVRLIKGEAPLWDYHHERLERSCRALALPDPEDLVRPRGGLDRVARFEVSRKGVEETERIVGSTRAVHLITARTVHRPYPHKSTDRAVFGDAVAEANRAGADDALMLTAEGYVAECSIWTVFWWEGDSIATPALSLGVLPGVARARLGDWAGPLLEHHLRREGLEGRSLFVANAVRGVVPVASLDGVRVPESPHTARLLAGFWP